MKLRLDEEEKKELRPTHSDCGGEVVAITDCIVSGPIDEDQNIEKFGTAPHKDLIVNIEGYRCSECCETGDYVGDLTK